jgi:hypothetical protein
MATFQIPGEIITSVTALGGGAPPSGYYAAKIEKIEPHPSRATARRMTLSFQGFSCTDWLNTPYDVEGKAIAGLNEKQVRGMVAAIKSVFLSAGYTNEQMSQGISRPTDPSRQLRELTLSVQVVPLQPFHLRSLLQHRLRQLLWLRLLFLHLPMVPLRRRLVGLFCLLRPSARRA